MCSNVVMGDAEAVELERRHRALHRDLAPQTELGAILVRKIAVTSLASEIATRREFHSRAERVRHAAERFDEQRMAGAGAILDSIHEDPRGNLRRLRAMPEGVELMVGIWADLKADLTRKVKPRWTAAHLVKAASLLGIREEDARGSRLGVLSDAIWGDFSGLSHEEGGGLAEEKRQAWARQHVAGVIDGIVAELEAHDETLDHQKLEDDRAEAGGRALVDNSRDSVLARRYESEASRGFYKALKEFREVEAEAASRPPAPAAPPAPDPEPAALGSFREEEADDDPMPAEAGPAPPRWATTEELEAVPHARRADGSPLAYVSGPDPGV